jgi:HSP20 family protein
MMRSPLLNELFSLRNTFDQFLRENPFGDAFDTLWTRSATSGGAVARPMPLDIYATDDDVFLVSAVPGMHPEDLNLSVQKNTITLSGTVQSAIDSEEGKNATWYLRELASGSYERSITLPFPVDADRADAQFENGILRVVLPKAEASKPKQIAIQTGRSQAIEANSTEKS